ncbi:MAG: M23 family metallopeptidase [Myxococcota bacterium]|nr:M23 family metallopeptidase [Myxococcota bacterium]
MRGFLTLIVIAVIGAGALLAWPLLEGEAPNIEAPEKIDLGVAGAQVEVRWTDVGTGLRNVDASLEIDTGARPLLKRTLHTRSFEGSAVTGSVAPQLLETATLVLDPKALNIPDGDATLVLRATDWAWSNSLSGNLTELRIPVSVDTKPPVLSVESGLTYIRRGGSAAVVYRVDADTQNHGVRVGDAFFPGTALVSGKQVALFAIPIDAKNRPAVRVIAADAAGNEAVRRFDVRIQERNFRTIDINLSNRFLDNVASEFGSDADGDDRVATFRRANEDMRAGSEDVIRNAIGPPTAKQSRGAFEQMYNSRVTSHFAELRHYRSGGKQVSQARHYGYDLASTGHAPITASNAGTVVFVGENGIYGQLVMLDHGLGLTTLYGHLSSIGVSVGDKVLKGAELGRSGATGLAGGDHLHFAILVGHTYVDPVEWWDGKWVREHIEVRLAPPAASAKR